MFTRLLVSRVGCVLRVGLREARRSSSAVAVEATDPRVQELLNSLAIPDVSKVLGSKVEPLRVPHYKLLTLEELEKVHKEATEKAKELLQTPPILPQRLPRGEVLEVDEGLAGATSHKMIFTETTHHKESKLRRIVVREPDGILRDATWDERDRMCEVFTPVHGRKMWLPKVLSDEGLGPVLKKELYVDVLDLLEVQCDPQAPDYHRVRTRVFEDMVDRGRYSLLYSTRYLGCLVWYLLTSSRPPRLAPLLQDMVNMKMIVNASEVIRLYMLCFPDDDVTVQLRAAQEAAEDADLVQVFCQHSRISGKEGENQ